MPSPSDTSVVAEPTSQPEGNSPAAVAPGALLLCLPSLPEVPLHAMLDTVVNAFAGTPLLIASPEYETEDTPVVEGAAPGSVRIFPYTTPRADLGWALAARDFITAAQIATERNASAVMLLGMDAGSLSPQALQDCANQLRSGADLALPRYTMHPNEGLVNASLLYPMTRALFRTSVRFPLASDAGLSTRLVQRLGALGQRQANLGQPDALLWPAAEAASVGYAVHEFAAGPRSPLQPVAADFNTLFAGVASSLFSDVESKASFWQRARGVPAGTAGTSFRPVLNSEATQPADIADLVSGYKLAFRNLQEVWSLVVPPQSLLALKKLSLANADEFSFPIPLWARVAYDFTLAFHARSLNRGHLLGAFTPLYLAWVASTLRSTGEDPQRAAAYVEETAAAFEREKPYLVARWRWPDRFNP